MFDGIFTNNAIAAAGRQEKEFFEHEIETWKNSKTRRAQIDADRYYRGEHDILGRVRTGIGQGGRLVAIDNLPNNRIVDNQYAKAVDQKTNYLFAKPFAFKTKSEKYAAALKRAFDKKFQRTLQNLAESSINGGVGWLHAYYGAGPELRFKAFRPWEVLPFWQDEAHTELDCVARVYDAAAYAGGALETVEKVELYKLGGVEYYYLDGGKLIEDGRSDYLYLDGKPYNWERLPVVPFKYNNAEISLLSKTKTIQDAINETLSDFQNSMQEDNRNTILIIKNYDGEDLTEFRHNLAAYGVIKVRSVEAGIEGGVDSLRVDVNGENFERIYKMLKKTFIENAMAYDAKDERLAGSPNQMNILSMYSDMDLDANGMESEYKASFEDLKFFLDTHFSLSGAGEFFGEELEISFDRDMLMNESDIINSARNSTGIISNKTIVANHPWVNDADEEMGQIEREKDENPDVYEDAFQKMNETIQAQRMPPMETPDVALHKRETA